MYRLGSAMILTAVVVLSVAGEAASQVRDRYDNSIDMRAPLSRQQQRTLVDNPPRTLPDNCYTGVATDKNVACAAPSRVTAPPTALPTVPCTPRTEARNPALGPMPGSCP
jgi:hypothetical protein